MAHHPSPALSVASCAPTTPTTPTTPPAAPAPFNLRDRLAEIAAAIRAQRQGLAKLVYDRLGRRVDAREFRAISESCTYIAFVEVGGRVDRPETFDWTGQRDALMAHAAQLMMDQLWGAGSDYAEERGRTSRRLDRAQLDSFRWDAWRDSSTGLDAEGHEQVIGSIAAAEDPSPLRDLVQQEFAALPDALAAVVSARDAQLLIGHYVHDRSYKDLAEDLLRSEGTPVTPTALKAAVNRVGVILKRARERARERLPEKYAYLLQEVA